MVVFLGIILVMTPPRVSIPRERGVTSRSRRSFMSPWRILPWIAAPTATASSGLTDLLGVFSKIFWTSSTTLGIRVMPPTRMTSSILFLGRSESLMQFSQGLMVLLRKSSVRDSSLALVSLKMKCLGPEASAVKKGRLTSVWVDWESSILAFSAASRSRWMAVLSLETSMPDCLLNSSRRKRWTMPSMSSPPQEVSPLVALTSRTPCMFSRIEISNVPPPKSQTAMILSCFFSIPQARAAAVGSLIILSTSRPAILLSYCLLYLNLILRLCLLAICATIFIEYYYIRKMTVDKDKYLRNPKVVLIITLSYQKYKSTQPLSSYLRCRMASRILLISFDPFLYP